MTDRRVLGRVARLYYEEGLTQAQIAELIGSSRVTVTRMLAEARSEGVVEIVIHSEEPLFSELERRLVTELGLSAAWVAPASHNSTALGRTGGRALRAVLPHARSVTVGLSEYVRDAVAHIGELSLPDLEIYPFGGGRPGRHIRSDAHDVGSALSARVGGTMYALPAQLIARDIASAQSLLGDPHLQSTLRAAAAADLAIVGVGGLPRAQAFLADWVEPAVFDELRGLGAIGDLSVRFFDRDGEPIASDLDRRVIGLTLEQMRAIPTRLIIAGGPEKTEVIRTAVTSGIATALVTDNEVAQALLDGV